MNLAFASKYLRLMCENQAEASETLGSDAARTLHAILAELDSAASLRDLINLSRDVRTDGPRAIVSAPGIELQLSANHIDNPVDDEGQIDWKQIRVIQVQRLRGGEVDVQ